MVERDENGFKCLKCDYSSKHKHNVTRHVEIHIDGLKFTCKYCTTQFKGKRLLYKHIAADHTEEKIAEKVTKKTITPLSITEQDYFWEDTDDATRMSDMDTENSEMEEHPKTGTGKVSTKIKVFSEEDAKGRINLQVSYL